MNELYLYVIIALLPLTAIMVVLQENPYHALVIRGFLGAVAALVYAVLGGADVALTEALVGTMLAVTLYAVAVRSSLVMRLGVLVGEDQDAHFQKLLANLRSVLSKRHLRLELISYPNTEALEQGLKDQEVHATCVHTEQPYPTHVRIKRIYEILKNEMNNPQLTLTHLEEKKN